MKGNEIDYIDLLQHIARGMFDQTRETPAEERKQDNDNGRGCRKNTFHS
jgi:hypothetical protein